MSKESCPVNTLVSFIAQRHLNAKLVSGTQQTDWVDWLSIPVPGYLDYGGEPVSFSMISAIKLSPFVKTHIGRLVRPVVENYAEEIDRFLKQNGYSFQTDDEGFIVLF